MKWRKYKEPVSTFNPALLDVYARRGSTWYFQYGAVRLEATIHGRAEGEEVFLTIHQPIPEEERTGLLAWFGIDENCEGRTFPDGSSYWMQRAA